MGQKMSQSAMVFNVDILSFELMTSPHGKFKLDSREEQGLWMLHLLQSSKLKQSISNYQNSSIIIEDQGLTIGSGKGQMLYLQVWLDSDQQQLVQKDDNATVLVAVLFLSLLLEIL